MTQLFKFMSRAFKLVFPGIHQDADVARQCPDHGSTNDKGNPTWQHSSAAPLAPPARRGLITAPQAGAQQQKITVAWYGGNWGDAFRACVAEPYTQATGVQVSPEVGTSTTTLAKLQQQKAAPTIDVAWLDGGISELAEQAGVLDTLDPAAIPNLKT